jgi:hypothetical protein
MSAETKWRVYADYMESCNCDFGCPCNFNGYPTSGRCEALVGYHLREGNYGEIKLDGLDFIQTASWPRAIHEGNGTGCVYITDRAAPEQRAALAAIAYGRAGGSGPFIVFAATFRHFLEPVFAPIEMAVDGKRSRFAVPGVLEVQLTPHVDPVSGAEQDVQIQLPNGFIWKTAQAVKTAVMRIVTPNLNFDYSGKNAFYSVVDYRGP